MIRMIDNTLTALDHCLMSKTDLHTFCNLLFTIGVDAIELSVTAYKQMEYLPEQGKFILNISLPDEIIKYPGFYRYIGRQDIYSENYIREIQINDMREILKLRPMQCCKAIRIVGLDDLICNSYNKLMKEMINSHPRVSFNFSPENTYGCAVALAVHWALEFGKDITTSFAGCKNNAATEEAIMAMRLAARHKPNRDLTVLPQLRNLYETFTKKKIGNRKPIIGKNIFRVEAGIHADGIMKNPATYEAYEPESVGGRTELVIGKHSGMKAVKLKMEELQIPLPGEDVIKLILRSVKSVCIEQRKSLSDNEFIELVNRVAVGGGIG